jgi:hypothetical protein
VSPAISANAGSTTEATVSRVRMNVRRDSIRHFRLSQDKVYPHHNRGLFYPRILDGPIPWCCLRRGKYRSSVKSVGKESIEQPPRDSPATMRGGLLAYPDLARGFDFDGRRVPLINPQRGIFKPREMAWLLSVKTVFREKGRASSVRRPAGRSPADLRRRRHC